MVNSKKRQLDSSRKFPDSYPPKDVINPHHQHTMISPALAVAPGRKLLRRKPLKAPMTDSVRRHRWPAAGSTQALDNRPIRTRRVHIKGSNLGYFHDISIKNQETSNTKTRTYKTQANIRCSHVITNNTSRITRTFTKHHQTFEWLPWGKHHF
jgi:hypothetical protein